MEKGFSQDGYITDQDMFSAYLYRTMSSDINGCGWIAAYNLRRALGQEPDFNQVREEMDGMFTLRVPGPTTMSVMRRYLKKYVPGYSLTSGKNACVDKASRSRAGIFRYWEQKVPHFVAFVRKSDGEYRFFNVADGLEDFSDSMESFARSHFTHGQVLVMTVE